MIRFGNLNAIGNKGKTVSVYIGRIDAKEAIAKIVEGYRASLEDDGGFTAEQFNNQCGADLFEYDDEADELVLRADLQLHPHYRIEFDVDYWGGNYGDVGDFAYIPVGIEFAMNSVEEAFEKLTGHSRRHIIHYSTDERFLPNGEDFPE